MLRIGDDILTVVLQKARSVATIAEHLLCADTTIQNDVWAIQSEATLSIAASLEVLSLALLSAHGRSSGSVEHPAERHFFLYQHGFA